MNTHEDDMVEYFQPRDGETVVDAGAAFGFYTLLASKCVGPSGRVISIEPQPDLFNLLNKNIRLNHIKNTTTLNQALYSSKTILKLYDNYSVIEERARSSNEEEGQTKGNGMLPYRDIQADRMDDLLLNVLGVEKVEWIKIDVEGAEMEVLKGARRVLSKNTDIKLLIEIHNVTGLDIYSEVVAFLSAFSFQIEFEKRYHNGERHVLFAKTKLPKARQNYLHDLYSNA